ncbi:hypothetical protein O0L34_g16491 [Tuta absoluta]|nr:hypothetical protein O0L34_g16491 [Tuta absoluta]
MSCFFKFIGLDAAELMANKSYPNVCRCLRNKKYKKVKDNDICPRHEKGSFESISETCALPLHQHLIIYKPYQKVRYPCGPLRPPIPRPKRLPCPPEIPPFLCLLNIQSCPLNRPPYHLNRLPCPQDIPPCPPNRPPCSPNRPPCPPNRPPCPPNRCPCPPNRQPNSRIKRLLFFLSGFIVGAVGQYSYLCNKNNPLLVAFFKNICDSYEKVKESVEKMNTLQKTSPPSSHDKENNGCNKKKKKPSPSPPPQLENDNDNKDFLSVSTKKLCTVDKTGNGTRTLTIERPQGSKTEPLSCEKESCDVRLSLGTTQDAPSCSRVKCVKHLQLIEKCEKEQPLSKQNEKFPHTEEDTSSVKKVLQPCIGEDKLPRSCRRESSPCMKVESAPCKTNKAMHSKNKDESPGLTLPVMSAPACEEETAKQDTEKNDDDWVVIKYKGVSFKVNLDYLKRKKRGD